MTTRTADVEMRGDDPMTGPTVESIGRALLDGLCRDDAVQAALCTQLVRRLAEGQPVSRERLAAALRMSRDEVDAMLCASTYRVTLIGYPCHGSLDWGTIGWT